MSVHDQEHGFMLTFYLVALRLFSRLSWRHVGVWPVSGEVEWRIALFLSSHYSKHYISPIHINQHMYAVLATEGVVV